MKTCTFCKEAKELRAFRIDPFAHLGRRSHCYDCERVQSRDRMRKKRGTKVFRVGDHSMRSTSQPVDSTNKA